MAKIRVNKVDVARRQIDAAIRMLFDNGDPVAIHTLAAAAGRILRDLCEKKGTRIHQLFKDHIAPGKQKAFWGVMNRPANFFKHADQDPDEILDHVDERVNDATLFFAIRDLGYLPTVEMRTLTAFFIATGPKNLLRSDSPPEFRELANQDWLRQAGRSEQLAVGKATLELIRRQV